MATKKTKLGFDPLSWMQDEKGVETKPEPTTTSKKKMESKTSTASRVNDNPLGLDAETLRSSFALLAPKANQLVSRF